MAVATGVRDRESENRYVVGLVLRAQAGDSEAESELDAIYRPRFERWVRRWLKNPFWHDDLVQVALNRLLRKLHQYKPERSAFNSWAFRVAKCAMLNEIARLDARRVMLSLDIDWMELKPALFGPEDDYVAHRAQEAVDKLEPEKRLAINGPLKDGLTDVEIARQLGIPARRVSYRRQQGLREAREALSEIPFTSIRPKTCFSLYKEVMTTKRKHKRKALPGGEAGDR